MRKAKGLADNAYVPESWMMGSTLTVLKAGAKFKKLKKSSRAKAEARDEAELAKLGSLCAPAPILSAVLRPASEAAAGWVRRYSDPASPTAAAAAAAAASGAHSPTSPTSPTTPDGGGGVVPAYAQGVPSSLSAKDMQAQMKAMSQGITSLRGLVEQVVANQKDAKADGLAFRMP